METFRTRNRSLSIWGLAFKDLEAAVTRLSPVEVAAFSAWFEEFLAELGDRKIEEDVRAGRLDEAGRKADEDFEAGRWTLR